MIRIPVIACGLALFLGSSFAADSDPASPPTSSHITIKNRSGQNITDVAYYILSNPDNDCRGPLLLNPALPSASGSQYGAYFVFTGGCVEHNFESAKVSIKLYSAYTPLTPVCQLNISVYNTNYGDIVNYADDGTSTCTLPLMLDVEQDGEFSMLYTLTGNAPPSAAKTK